MSAGLTLVRGGRVWVLGMARFYRRRYESANPQCGIICHIRVETLPLLFVCLQLNSLAENTPTETVRFGAHGRRLIAARWHSGRSNATGRRTLSSQGFALSRIAMLAAGYTELRRPSIESNWRRSERGGDARDGEAVREMRAQATELSSSRAPTAFLSCSSVRLIEASRSVGQASGGRRLIAL